MTHAETIEKLCSLRNRGSKFGIDRMRLLSDAIGAPQKHFPAIHLAGTNGKGSTAAMIESMLRGNAMRVGLYTSPHLVKLGERIQVNRKPLSDEAICLYTEKLYNAAKQFGKPGDEDFPSFFELMTAMAFLHFSSEKCDAAIIETGLGGRLDATNILNPKVCVITSIGLDHCDMLGNTIEAVAAEKAGIIKANTPVVLGCVPAEAERVIRSTAGQKSAPVFSVRERFGDAITAYPQTNLFGDHQRKNAATALLAAEVFFREMQMPVPADFSEALKNIYWPARWEQHKLRDGRELIIDVAHNAECAVALDSMLAKHFVATGTRPTIIAGVLGIDRARPILSTLAKHAKQIVLVRPSQDRACTIEELRACIPTEFCGEIRESDIATLFPRAGTCTLTTREHESLIVAGSCYLAGEVLAALAGTSSEEGAALQDKLPKSGQ